METAAVTTCPRCKEPLAVYHLEAGHTYALSLPESFTEEDGRDAASALMQATAHLSVEQKPIIILMRHGAEVTPLPEAGRAT